MADAIGGNTAFEIAQRTKVNEALATAQEASATASEALATVAESAGWPSFATISDGLAGTSEGGTFAVAVDGSGSLYRHDPGPVATFLWEIISAKDVEDVEASLAAPDGSGKIGFQRQAGAPLLTGDAMFRRQLNARELGVVPGMADATEATQGAMNYAATNGLNLELPGHDIIVRTLEIPNYLKMRGNSKRKTRIIHKAGETGAMLTLPEGVVIELDFSDMYIWGNDEGHAGEHGLYAHARPVSGGPNGGLWWSKFTDLQFAKFGGKAIWLRGGTGLIAADCPNQFLNFHNTRVMRARSATSRCLSITGKTGQVYFTGTVQFDCEIPDVLPWLGTNACMSREYSNGDAADGGSPVSDVAPYTIVFPATVQNSDTAILIDRAGPVDLQGAYLENNYRGAKIQGTAVVNAAGMSFRNSASDGAGGGYAISASNSHVTVGRNQFYGGVEKRYIGAGLFSIVNEGGDFGSSSISGTSSGVVPVFAPSAGTLDIRALRFLQVTGDNASPPTITAIDGRHSVGDECVIRATATVVFNQGTFLSIKRTVMRGGDTITVKRGDTVWYGVQQNIAPLQASAMPTNGYYEAGEFVRNTAAHGAGTVTLGWQRLTTGIGHVAGTDWRAIQVTAT